MKQSNYSELLLLALLGVIFVLLHVFFGIPQGEGFNPSDDGVILAQAFRLLQGQIPHLDFISIRPIGSAVLHSIHFFSFLPLELSARWFVVVEFMLIAFFWTALVSGGMAFRNVFHKRLIVLFFGTWIFVLTESHYNLFPWTTIDALLLISIALFFYQSILSGNQLRFQHLVWCSFFAVSAALCRQTFALPAVILLLLCLFKLIKHRKVVKGLAGLLVGAFPAWLYLFVLIRNQVLSGFIDQMTGRSELWATGFNQFGNSFWSSPVLVLFIALMITVLMVKFIYPSGDQDRVWARIAPAYYLVLSASMLLFGFIALLVPKLLFYCSFQLFWLTLCVVLLNTFHPGSGSIRFLAVMGLVIAWTSAVSLGDNAPVFSTGILFGTGFSLALNEWQKVVKATRSSLLNFQLTGAFVLTIAILSLGVYAQKRSNYRDLPSRELHFSLQAVFPEMGGVRTNQNSFEYMREVARLYNQLGQPKDRFAVIPNGAIIYPILNSASPLPLDWMQAAEFVGQDSLVIEMMRANIKERELYFLIEKYNSKLLADSLIAARFPDKDYPYMEALVQMTRIVEQLESAFFEIRVSK